MTQDRFEPVPDTPAGENIPYRGVVDHGVAYDQPELTDEAHYHMGREVEYEPEMQEPTPIPVRIVREGEREIRTIQTSHVTLAAGEGSRQILGRDDRRTSVRIKNLGVDNAFIGNMNVSQYSGWRLDADALEITLSTTEPVYGLCPTGSAELQMLVETVEAVK
jgi:hypothetical protein